MAKKALIVEVAVMKTDISYIKKQIDEMNDKFDTFIDKADKSYAGKYVEQKIVDSEKDMVEVNKKITNIHLRMAAVCGGAVVVSFFITRILGKLIGWS